MSKITANTIAANDKKAFEIFLKALVVENITDEDKFQQIYDKYNKKFQGKMAGRQLEELLLNAVEHIAKQGQGHKWSAGPIEEQLKSFDKEGFQRLLKLNPTIKQVWDRRHTEEAKQFLPENSALASVNEKEALELASKVYDIFEEKADVDYDQDGPIFIGESYTDIIDSNPELEDVSDEMKSFLHKVFNVYNDLENPYITHRKTPEYDLAVQLYKLKHPHFFKSKSDLEEIADKILSSEGWHDNGSGAWFYDPEGKFIGQEEDAWEGSPLTIIPTDYPQNGYFIYLPNNDYPNAKVMNDGSQSEDGEILSEEDFLQSVKEYAVELTYTM